MHRSTWLASLAALGAQPAAAKTSGPRDPGCQAMSLPGALAPGGPADQTVSAEYCVRLGDPGGLCPPDGAHHAHLTVA